MTPKQFLAVSGMLSKLINHHSAETVSVMDTAGIQWNLPKCTRSIQAFNTNQKVMQLNRYASPSKFPRIHKSLKSLCALGIIYLKWIPTTSRNQAAICISVVAMHLYQQRVESGRPYIVANVRFVISFVIP